MFNPQNLNRYSYVRSNPIRYNDPSGHNPACGPDGVFCSNNFDEAYGISFGGDWTNQNKAKVRVAVKAVAAKFASEKGIKNPALAFAIFGAVHFQWGGCDACKGGGGYAYGYQKRGGYHLIAFESLTGMSSTQPDAFMLGVKNVVHELGHIYNNILDKGPSKDLDSNRPDLRLERDLFLRPNNAHRFRLDWQQHPIGFSNNSESGSEAFADMFIAWTFNAWNTNTSPENVLAVSKAQTWMSQWKP